MNERFGLKNFKTAILFIVIINFVFVAFLYFGKYNNEMNNTSEDLKVLVKNYEGEGFKYMMENLSQERLVIAVGALGVVEQVLRYTTQYTLERMAFNQPIGKFQNSRFKLAEMKTEAEIGRVFIDDCIELLNKKKL